MDGPKTAVPGSAEFLASQLSGPELSCPHFPKYRAEEDRRYPSRLGFFSSDSEPKVLYIDTKKLCIACLEAAVPDGFNYIPSTKPKSSTLPTKASSSSLQAFQAGFYDVNRSSERRPTPDHLIASPVSISLSQIPGGQDGWNWLKSQRKPFYADTLHPSEDRPPIVKANVLRDAEIASHAGTPTSVQPITLNSPASRAVIQDPVVSKAPAVKKKQAEPEKKKKIEKATAKNKSQNTVSMADSPDISSDTILKIAMKDQNDTTVCSVTSAGSVLRTQHKEISNNTTLNTTMATTTIRSWAPKGQSVPKPKADRGNASQVFAKSSDHDAGTSPAINSTKTANKPQTSSSIIDWQDLMMPMAAPVSKLDATNSAQNPGIKKPKDVEGRAASRAVTATAQVKVNLSEKHGELHDAQAAPVAAAISTPRSQAQQSTVSPRPRCLAKNWSRHDPIPFQKNSQIPPLKAYKRTAGIHGQADGYLPLEKLLPKGTLIANDQNLSRFQFSEQSSDTLRQVLASSSHGPHTTPNNTSSSLHFIESLLSGTTSASIVQAHNAVVQGAFTASKTTRSVKKENRSSLQGHGPATVEATSSNNITTQSCVFNSETVKATMPTCTGTRTAKKAVSSKDQTRAVSEEEKDKTKQTSAPPALAKPAKSKEASSSAPAAQKEKDLKNQENKSKNDQSKISSIRSLETTSAVSSSTATASATKESMNRTEVKKSTKVHEEASAAENKTRSETKHSDSHISTKEKKAKGSGNSKSSPESTLTKVKDGLSSAAAGGSESLHKLKSKLEGDKGKKMVKSDVKKEGKKEGKPSKPAKTDHGAGKPTKTTGDKSVTESKKKEKVQKSVKVKASESRGLKKKKDVKSKTTKTITKRLHKKKVNGESSEDENSSDEEKDSSVDTSDSDASDAEDEPGSSSSGSDSNDSAHGTTSHNSSESSSSEDEAEERLSDAEKPKNSNAAEDSDQLESSTKPEDSEATGEDPAHDGDVAQVEALTEDGHRDPNQPPTTVDSDKTDDNKAEDNAALDDTNAAAESEAHNNPSVGGNQLNLKGQQDPNKPSASDQSSTTEDASGVDKGSSAEDSSGNRNLSAGDDTHTTQATTKKPAHTGGSSSSTALAGAAIAGATVAGVVVYNIMNTSSTTINIVDQSTEETIVLTRPVSPVSVASSSHGHPQGEDSDAEGGNSGASTVHAVDEDFHERSSSSSSSSSFASDGDNENVNHHDDSKSHSSGGEGHHDGQGAGWVSSDDDDNHHQTRKDGHGGYDSDSDDDNIGQHSRSGVEDSDDDQHGGNNTGSDQAHWGQDDSDNHSVSGSEHSGNGHVDDSDDDENHHAAGNSSGDEGNSDDDSDGEGDQDGSNGSGSSDEGQGDSDGEGGSEFGHGDDNDSDYCKGSSEDDDDEDDDDEDDDDEDDDDEDDDDEDDDDEDDDDEDDDDEDDDDEDEDDEDEDDQDHNQNDDDDDQDDENNQDDDDQDDDFGQNDYQEQDDEDEAEYGAQYY